MLDNFIKKEFTINHISVFLLLLLGFITINADSEINSLSSTFKEDSALISKLTLKYGVEPLKVSSNLDKDIFELLSPLKKHLTNRLVLGTSISNFNYKSFVLQVNPPGFPTVGRKISELTWSTKDAKLLGIDASIITTFGLSWSANYKHNIPPDKGYMVDLDWLTDDKADLITHWSKHDNTLVSISILDLGVKYGYTFSPIDLNPWVSLGYKQENYILGAIGGYGEYEEVAKVLDGLMITKI